MLLPSNQIRVFDHSLVKEKEFFKGSMNYKQLAWDPFVQGYAFIIWVKIPFWVEQIFGGAAGGGGVVAKFLERNFHSLSGISDIELETATQSHGFTAQESHVPTTTKKGNAEFTIKMQEFSGSPVRNLFAAWTSGIRDPESGIATYPRQFNCDYAAKNHTGQMLYIVTRPDANNVEKKNIEFACFWDAVFPTKHPMGSHLNYDKGSHDLVDLDIDFKGNFHISPKVHELAVELLKTTYYFREEAEYDPKVDTLANGGVAEILNAKSSISEEFPFSGKDLPAGGGSAA